MSDEAAPERQVFMVHIGGQPTLKGAELDARQGTCKIVGLTFESVKVAYTEHPTFGTEEFEFVGVSNAQLVPFSEIYLRTLGLTVPTIECPVCTGRNVRNCTTCGGKGKVLPSQVTSQQAAASPTLDRYRDGDGDHIVPTDDD